MSIVSMGYQDEPRIQVLKTITRSTKTRRVKEITLHAYYGRVDLEESIQKVDNGHSTRYIIVAAN